MTSQLPGPQTAALIGGVYNDGGDRGDDQQDDDEAWALFSLKGNNVCVCVFFFAKCPCVLVN